MDKRAKSGNLQIKQCSSRHRAHWKGNVLSLGFKGLESRCVYTSVRLTGVCYMARKGGGEVAASARRRNIFLVIGYQDFLPRSTFISNSEVQVVS